MVFVFSPPAVIELGNATGFDFELEDPVLKRTIKHGYDVATLPVRG